MHATNHVRDDGSALLVLTGEIDLESADEVRERGLSLLAADSAHTLIVDMMDVSFIDSTAIAALVTVRNAAVDSGTSLVLLDPSPRVLKILEITQLDDVFEIRHTE